MTQGLRVTEVFYSLQGEARDVGRPTTFVRLTGCPLRCQYCDTAYAFHGGASQSLDEVLAQVANYPARYVTVTGGEPLAQPQALPLMVALCDRGYHVSLETSGALPIDNVDPRVSRVLDVKTPGSGESHRNLASNWSHLTPHDQVKFVLCSRDDYDWAKNLCASPPWDPACEVLFSPSYQQLLPTELAAWVLADGLNVRFQVQLHKVLWGDAPGR